MKAPCLASSAGNWAARTLLAGVFASALTRILYSPGTHDMGPLIGAGAAVISGVLFLLPHGDSISRLTAASTLTGLIAVTLLEWVSAPGVSLGPAVGGALMLYLIGALVRLVGAEPQRRLAAAAWALFLICVIGASPIWMGPLIDRLQPGRGVVDTLIALNPLTHLSVLAGTDYLRSEFFYRHSPLGGLRYDYPSPKETIAGLLLACALASWAVRRGGWWAFASGNSPNASAQARRRSTHLPQQSPSSEAFR